MFFGRSDAEAQAPIFWLKDSWEKTATLTCHVTLLALMWERLSEEEEEDNRSWVAWTCWTLLIQQKWVWANCWRRGSAGKRGGCCPWCWNWAVNWKLATTLFHMSIRRFSNLNYGILYITLGKLDASLWIMGISQFHSMKVWVDISLLFFFFLLIFHFLIYERFNYSGTKF